MDKTKHLHIYTAALSLYDPLYTAMLPCVNCLAWGGGDTKAYLGHRIKHS